MQFTNILVQGLLIGGLYALLAAGLALVLGVMRIVNLAHGDFIIVAAFMATTLSAAMGGPSLALLVAVPFAMGLLGYALQRGLLNRIKGGDILAPLLVTFGLSKLLQNLMLEVFSADSQKLQIDEVEAMSITLVDGVTVGVFPLMVLVTAIVMIAGLTLIIGHTQLGRAFRAVADDPEVAAGMGLSTPHVFGLAMALALAVAGLSGTLLAAWTSFNPLAGPPRLLLAFEVVVIGGLGSIWGALLGGMVLGVAQAIGGYIDPGWQTLAGHIAFLLIVLVRPNGLIPKGAQ